MSADSVLKELETSLETGLTPSVAEARAQQHGPNLIAEEQRHTKLALILRQLKGPLIFILLLAAFVTLVLGEWFDAIIIALAILVNTMLGFYQEYKAETAVAHLRSFVTVRTLVLRGNREFEIDAADVVLGDILHLRQGNRVPADARILNAQGLRVDESVLTGESLPNTKHSSVLGEETLVAERHNMVYGGTLVTEGSALVGVTAIGKDTEFGKIADLVKSAKREETPLQRTLASLAMAITIVVSVLVLLVFTLGVTRGEPIAEMFLISIAVAVGAIPEALPVALTAVLAIGVERLAKRKGIMRSLSAAETLGSTTVVMTDKTGTLTQAKLALVELSLAAELRDNGPTPEGHVLPNELSKEHRELLMLAAIASDVAVENPDAEPSAWRIVGSPLETAIVRSAASYGMAHTLHDDSGVRAVVPFSSIHKFSAHAGFVELESDITGTKRGYAHIVLGAPDILLARSRMSESGRASIHARIEAESNAGKRLVGVGVSYVTEASGTVATMRPADIKDLIFVGTLAFFDALREEVPEAIRRIEGYGVRVIIATGDLPGTAVAIARDLGWHVEPEEVLTGSAMSMLTDAELKLLLENVKICARVTPQDKLRVARLFQARGEVVAMTGDGVNDAPSLKVVDIGIAVGSGSDVAKGVADLILLDDNFNTIVAAIEEGRRVLKNLRKAFVYLVATSFDEVVLIGGSLLLGLALPLTAVQIIWVNFFTGSLPAVAFAFDEGHTTARGIARSRGVLGGSVVHLTVSIGAFTSLSLLALYAILVQQGFSLEVVQTFIFACFSSYILFVAFSLRNLELPITHYDPFANRFLNVAVAIGLTLLLATLYVPFLQEIFSTTTLSISWLTGVALFVAVNICVVEGAKWLYRRSQKN